MSTSLFQGPPRTPLQPRSLFQRHPHQPAAPGPFSSPIASGSSSPGAPSSPLNPYSHSNAKGSNHYSAMSKGDSRRASYKARRPGYSCAPTAAPPPPAPPMFSVAEVPHNNLLRDRMKAKCAARMAKDRSRSKRQKGGQGIFDRSSSSENGGDMEMDEEGEDSMNDPLFLRFMAADMRREKHREAYNFQRHVGSSFDPELEDLNEWESYLKPGTPNPPSPTLHAVGDQDLDEEDLDEDFIRSQYEAYLEHEEGGNSAPSVSSAPSTMEVDDGSQHNQDDGPRWLASRNQFLNQILASSCPQCSSSLSIAMEVGDAVTCVSCRTTFTLNDAATSWTEDHPAPDSSHIPSWSIDPLEPSSILFLCSHRDCVWMSGL